MIINLFLYMLKEIRYAAIIVEYLYDFKFFRQVQVHVNLQVYLYF